MLIRWEGGGAQFYEGLGGNKGNIVGREMFSEEGLNLQGVDPICVSREVGLYRYNMYSISWRWDKIVSKPQTCNMNSILNPNPVTLLGSGTLNL